MSTHRHLGYHSNHILAVFLVFRLPLSHLCGTLYMADGGREAKVMRYMPTFFDDGIGNLVDGVPRGCTEIPPIPAGAWDKLVQTLLGRRLSADEIIRLKRMQCHNWSARVAAEELLGRDLTNDEVTAGMRDVGLLRDE